MKEYIVTGATGYVGYVLVHKLIENGYQPVKILIRSKKSKSRFSHLPVEVALGDINDEQFLEREISPKSVVFHLARIVDIGNFKKQQIYETNVNGSLKIINACINNKAEKLIYTSSVSAIVPPKNNEKIVEPKHFELKKLSGHYAKSKAITTNYLLNKSQNGKLNAVVAYPSAIIGPYDYNVSNLGQVVISYLNKSLFAYTKGKYNFVDVRDVAAGLIKCYEEGKSGEGYLLTGQTVTLKEMFEILNEILNRPKLPLKLPLWFIKMVLPFVELFYTIKRKNPIFGRSSIRFLNQNSNFDNTKAKQELNFNPRPVAISFNDMINWFYENKPDLLKKHN